ncbi:MAG TPA: hypothetical protein PLQ85_11585 [Anaerolineae bacterium]|nr:hypothetical protein [Anaerolineae bacterium]
MPTAFINADQLELVLVTHRLAKRPTSLANEVKARWCVMSARTVTNDCGRSPHQIRMKSVAGPMERGYLYRVMSREACRGAKDFKRTYGIGVRAWAKHENHYLMERQS